MKKPVLMIVSAAVCSAFIAAPAVAAPLTPNPMSAKYRDVGAKPASGRSGSAAIEARALVGGDGVTDIEITTGHFEGVGAQGTLAKVQIKLLAPNGTVLQTDNYRKTLAGDGYASFTYDHLGAGRIAQVQANVTGIDPNRTDVVTVSTTVKRRPDIEATLHAPTQTTVDSMVVVHGFMAELNGDLGARATCRLLVDGTEIDSIPGAWVDAASAVTCEFRTAFSTVGTKRLTLRVTDVTPGDYDPANNEVSRSIEVVAPQPFSHMAAFIDEMEWDYRMRYVSTFTGGDGVVSEMTAEYGNRQHLQSFSVRGSFPGVASQFAGQIVMRHSMDGNVLPVLAADVADFNASDGVCRWAELPGGTFTICPARGITEVNISHHSGEATYVVSRGTSTGPRFEWFRNFDYPSSTIVVPGMFPYGSSWVVDLRHEADGVVHQGGVQVSIVPPEESSFDTWDFPDCMTYRWTDGVQNDCLQETQRYSVRYGATISDF
jgi:hypothetical protein